MSVIPGRSFGFRRRDGLILPTLAYITGARSTSNTISSMPTHLAPGVDTVDLLIGYGIRGSSTTPPDMPSGQGWNDPTDSTGASTNSSIRVFWKFCDSDTEAFGTATNATRCAVQLWRYTGTPPTNPIGQIEPAASAAGDAACSYAALDDEDIPFHVSFGGYVRTAISGVVHALGTNFSTNGGSTGREFHGTSNGAVTEWPSSDPTMTGNGETIVATTKLLLQDAA